MTETPTLSSATSAETPAPGRPILHFTAKDTWLNDPNGLVYSEGTYHLYYQNNPCGNTWGNMCWGHATSTDLVTWAEHPVAIAGDSDEDVFSGSIVIDSDNTSGFGSPGNPVWVAIYTSAFTDASPHRGTQAQSLAYSFDSGMTWTKYSSNPVLTRSSQNFRDPKVFWYSGTEGSYWVMVAVEALEHKVLIYRSPNLLDWEQLSEFGPANATGGEWECPDLFPLPLDGDPDATKWVLTVNINPGAVAGGSGGQYFVGHFDGVRFVQDQADPDLGDGASLFDYQWLDWGRDYYAAVSFSNPPDNRRIMIGWMNNWDYANQIPTAPWRSAMSLAREVTLSSVEGRPSLIQKPVLPSSFGADSRGAYELPGPAQLNDSSLTFPDAPTGTALIIRAEFHAQGAQRFGLVLHHSGAPEGGSGASTAVLYDAIRGGLTVDRSGSGNTDFHPLFASREYCPLHLEDGSLSLEIIVDQCSIEVFAQGGQAVLTDLIFPSGSRPALSVFAEGGDVTLTKLTVAAMRS